MAGFLSFQLYEPAGKHKEIPEKGGDHFRKRRIFFFKIQCFFNNRGIPAKRIRGPQIKSYKGAGDI